MNGDNNKLKLTAALFLAGAPQLSLRVAACYVFAMVVVTRIPYLPRLTFNVTRYTLSL